MTVPVEVVGAVLVDLAVTVVIDRHGVLPLGDVLLDRVEDAVGIHRRADVEDVVVHQALDPRIGRITRHQLIDDVEADLGAGVLVAVGAPVDPLGGLPLVALHRGDVLDPLRAGIAQLHEPVDRRSGAHVRDRQDVDPAAHVALPDLDQLGELRIGPGDLLQVVDGARIAVEVVEVDGDLLGGRGWRERRRQEQSQRQSPPGSLSCNAVHGHYPCWVFGCGRR
jgi:hypothetical protein